MNLTNKTIDGVLVVRPTRDELTALEVGDMVVDCFGHIVPVATIDFSGISDAGKRFIGISTPFGEHGTMTSSFVEGEVVLTLPVCDKWHRSENVPSF
jgi:uncharacterized protein (DUF2126 family)